ncbi:unnamed protein product, partial [Ectocarpus sp. 13 AM-2016]
LETQRWCRASSTSCPISPGRSPLLSPRPTRWSSSLARAGVQAAALRKTLATSWRNSPKPLRH